MSTTATSTSTSTEPATVRPTFSESERLALAGYLAGYQGMTREAYTMDLRRFTGWCRDRSMSLFEVRRAGIEMFARDLEDKGRARAAVTRRPSTIAGFCKYAAEEVAHDLGPSSAVTLHEKRPGSWPGIAVRTGDQTRVATNKFSRMIRERRHERCRRLAAKS
jgi:integrase/recombinase XerD